MPVKKGQCYYINIGYLTFNPADSSTYFSGENQANAPSTTADYTKIYFPRNGTIKKIVFITIANSADGTNEQIDVSFRLNNTTDTLIASVSASAAKREFINNALNIPVTSSDYGQIKMVCPAWATNPTGVVAGGHIYIVC